MYLAGGQDQRLGATFQGMGTMFPTQNAPPECGEIPASTLDNTGVCQLPWYLSFPHTSLPDQVVCDIPCERGTTLPVWVIATNQFVDTDISRVQQLSRDVVIDIMALVVLLVFAFVPCPGTAGSELLGDESLYPGLL